MANKNNKTIKGTRLSTSGKLYFKKAFAGLQQKLRF